MSKTSYKTNMKAQLSFLMLIGLSFVSFAQEKTINSIWVDSIQVDGDLSDWRDTLTYYFEDQGLKYSIANDANNIYIAIQVPDIAQQQKAIYSGFSITVNPESKEKSGPTVVYPIPDMAALRSTRTDEESSAKPLQRILDMVRAIYIYSFENIVDGKISLNNTYGIRAAAKIDSTNVLNYEAAINIKQLNIDKASPFTLNLRINETITSSFTEPNSMRGMYGYPYYGRDPYGRGSTSRSRIVTKTQPGVWHIVKLATTIL